MFKRIMKRLEEVAAESTKRERKKEFKRRLKHGKPVKQARTTGSTGPM